jgi:hypothetical protein
MPMHGTLGEFDTLCAVRNEFGDLQVGSDRIGDCRFCGKRVCSWLRQASV